MLGEVTLDVFFTLLGMIPSVIGAFGIGTFFGAKSSWTKILLGLLITSSIGSCFVYFNSGLVRPVIVLIFICGILFTFRKFSISTFRISIPLQKIRIFINRETIEYSIIFCSVLLLTYKFLPWFYPFENHDVMYFGWIQDLWNNNQSTHVQVPTAWPMELGSTHTLPGIFIASIAAFMPSVNLIEAVFIRSLLVICCLFVLLISFYKKSPNKFLPLLGGLAVFGLLYGQNVGYEFTISSYLYLIVLIEILRQFLLNFESRTTIFLLLIFLPLTKAPIAFIAMGAIICYAFLFRRNINWKVSSLPIILLPINFISLMLAPTTNANKDTQFSFFGLKNLTEITNELFSKDWLDSFSGLAGWNVDWVSTFLFPNIFDKNALPFALFTYILVFIFGGYVVLRSIQIRSKISNEIETKSFIVIDAIMILAAISLAGVRNGDSLGVGHQAHAYLIASVIPFVLGIYVFEQLVSKKKALFFIVTSMCLYALTGTSINSRTLAFRWTDYPYTTVSPREEIVVNTKDGFYLPADGEDLSRAQVIASMKGLLLKYDPKNDYGEHSQVNNFIKAGSN